MQMPGLPGELAVRVRHVRRADLVPADDEPDRRVDAGRRGRRGSFRRARRMPCRRRARRADRRESARRCLTSVRAGGRRRRSAAAASVSPRRPGRRSGWCACRPTLQAAAARGRTPSPPIGGSGGVHRLGPGLEPGATRAVGHGCPARADLELAVQEVADAGPGMGVGVGDAAGREVDAIAARDPVDAGSSSTACERSAPLPRRRPRAATPAHGRHRHRRRRAPRCARRHTRCDRRQGVSGRTVSTPRRSS